MRSILAAAALVAFHSAGARAADLPVQTAYWTGIYIGANAGYGSGKQESARFVLG
jgi:opacity protein-like surface antigen